AADRVLGSDSHEPVFDDAVRHVPLAEGAADLRDLLHGEAAVFRDDQRLAAGEALLQLGYRLTLGLRRHGPPLLRRAAGARRWEVDCMSTPLRRRLGGLPDLQGR